MICFVCVCVWYLSERTVGSLEASTIQILNRKHPTEPSFPVGIWPQSLHTTLCPKPSFPSSASSGIWWNIPGVGWELCNSCCEETVRPILSSHNVQNGYNYKWFCLRKHPCGVFMLSVRQAHVLITAIQKILLKLSRLYGRVIFNIPGVKF